MIKKIMFIVCMLFIITGCSDNSNLISNELDNSNDIVDIDNEENNENIYIDDNPIKIALYNGKNKITYYNTTLANFKDIGVFDVYYTDIDTLDSSSSRDNYPKFYNEYENIDDYKTGFYITFEAEGKTVEQLILDPSSMHAMGPFLYVYLYDDVNQAPGTYYSHLEMDDMDENTIISSIKLFLAERGKNITSPISMTVFTYNGEEDFDDDGKYRGISSYTIEINVN